MLHNRSSKVLYCMVILGCKRVRMVGVGLVYRRGN